MEKKLHSIAALCRHYRVRNYFVSAANIGIRNQGEIKWFGYSPVDGYTLIGQTKTPSKGAEYRRLEG